MKPARLFAVLGFALMLSTPAHADPDFWQHEFPKTDFSKSAVMSWQEIRSGGPGRDGIPAITDPQFLPAADVMGLSPREPVITVALDGARARAYPLRYLTWHEIVNDEIAGTPVAVTFCPLCNSALTYYRRNTDVILTLGVTGKLRKSDMIMYDRETETWWQQATGEAIVGTLTGARLKPVPSWLESWAQFRQSHPDGLVMAEPPFPRDYGRNPYENYDSSKRPFLYDGALPPHDIPALMRVVRVGNRAWPMERLHRETVIREAGVVISWTAGQASALDTGVLADGRDVGSIRVRDDTDKDVPHDVLFAFAFNAFWPEGEWMLGNR